MEVNATTSSAKLYLSGLIVSLIIVLATPRLLDIVAALGHQFFQTDMASDYLKGVLWALFLGAGILFWPVSSRDKRLLLLAWCGKVVVALVVMLLYEDHYSLDACGYFLDSRLPEGESFNFLSGTANIIAICRMHHAILPDSYHAMKVTFSMLGLIGIYLFYRAAVMFMNREDGRIFLLLALFPGILFWSSILGKDPVVFLGIAMYSFGVVGWQRRSKFSYLLWLLAGILLATIIRQWLGLIMTIPLGVTVLVGMRGMTRAVLGFFFLVTLIVCGRSFMTKFQVSSAGELFAAADMTTKGFVATEGGSTQQLDVDLTNPLAVVKFLPIAAFTALFRPLPGEVLNPFGLLAGVESSLLLYLLLRSLRRTKLRELSDPILLWAITFIAVWALINGIVSSANFGVGVRYKLQILPLLLGVLIYLARERGPAPSAGEAEVQTGGSPAPKTQAGLFPGCAGYLKPRG